MTEDLDNALRAMLAERAHDIRSVPTSVLMLHGVDTDVENDTDVDTDADAEVLDLRLRRADVLRVARRSWPLLLAAAAVAAILAGVLTTLHVGPSTHTPTLNRQRHTAGPVPTVQQRSCVVTDPSQWNADVASATFVPTGIEAVLGAGVQSALPNGGALIEYSRGDYPGNSIGDDLGVLSPETRTPSDLGYFGVPSRGDNASFSLDAEVDNSSPFAVVSVEGGAGQQSSIVRSVYAVNVDDGHRELLTTQSRYPHGELQAAFVQDGSAYWQVDQAGSDLGLIYAVPVSGGTPRVVGRNHGVELEQSALGLEWSENGPIERPADVPAVVARHGATAASDTFGSFVTDGTAYAWATESGALQWYSPSAGHVVSFPKLSGGARTLKADVLGVAGPLVFFQGKNGDANWILDTRSGARVRITSGGTFVGAGGVVIADPLLAGGRESQTGQLMRLSTDDLARLHC